MFGFLFVFFRSELRQRVRWEAEVGSGIDDKFHEMAARRYLVVEQFARQDERIADRIEDIEPEVELLVARGRAVLEREIAAPARLDPAGDDNGVGDSAEDAE